MRNGVLLAVGLALLLLQGVIARIVPTEYVVPSLVMPMVLTMSVGDFSLVRGMSLSFVLGYLTDVGAGGSMGLWTFTLMSMFLFARVAGLKLFLHGVLFQMLLSFLAMVAAGLEMMALVLVFDRRPLAMGAALGVVLAQGVATAVCAPWVFALVRRLPGVSAPRPDEAAA